VEEERIRPYVPTVSYWLLGTDPTQFNYADLEREFSTRWDGVTDYVALKFLRDFDAGDEAMVCETGDEPRIVGIVRIVSDAYPDPQQDGPEYMTVDVEVVGRLDRPVALDDILDHPDFRDLDIEELGELSVVPLTPRQWERLLEMSRGPRQGDESTGQGTEDTGTTEATNPQAALVGEESR
jgi:predicted RNA-binding protein with PUA-like domain